jgi:hypothetical protein
MLEAPQVQIAAREQAPPRADERRAEEVFPATFGAVQDRQPPALSSEEREFELMVRYPPDSLKHPRDIGGSQLKVIQEFLRAVQQVDEEALFIGDIFRHEQQI